MTTFCMTQNKKEVVCVYIPLTIFTSDIMTLVRYYLDYGKRMYIISQLMFYCNANVYYAKKSKCLWSNETYISCTYVVGMKTFHISYMKIRNLNCIADVLNDLVALLLLYYIDQV